MDPVGEFPPGSFGRNLGKLEHAGKANPGLQTRRAEFADRIGCYPNPSFITSLAFPRDR